MKLWSRSLTDLIKVMSRQKLIERVLALRELSIRAARISLWDYCKLLYPDFYKNTRPHLKILCNTLQGVYEETIINPESNEPFKKIMINLPPRHGKSRTLILFCSWALGKDNNNRIISCSYNDEQATEFSRHTRDEIARDKNQDEEIIYTDIFPGTEIKKGDASYQKWSLEGQHFNYKGAGVKGSITGKGCNIAIIDDPIKDAETAFNENELEKIYRWYTGTFLSRIEKDAMEVLLMTRWSTKDLCGRIEETLDYKNWLVLKMPAYDSIKDRVLCDELLNKSRYDFLNNPENFDPFVFVSNYEQKPVNEKDLLYKEFKTYHDIPRHPNGAASFESITSYTDTADTGECYLCEITAGKANGYLYILNITYTIENMDKTDHMLADSFCIHDVHIADIESNNGGRKFAKNVEEKLRNKGNTKTIIRWFNQSLNKVARILTNANTVSNIVLMPENYKIRWPSFAKHLLSTPRKGLKKYKWLDCSDAITGLIEKSSKPATDPKVLEAFNNRTDYSEIFGNPGTKEDYRGLYK